MAKEFTMSMQCDLEGLLANAGRAARAGDEDHGGGYDFALNELATNLREVRDRWRAGDATAIDEFFGIYVFRGTP